MTKAEFWINQRDYACKWLNTPAEQLPGTLTHEKCFALLQEAESNLIDLERYTAHGQMTYAD
jgi:hypothetical protein